MNENECKVLIEQLSKIGIALSTEHNLNRLLEMIVREIRSFTASDAGSLYIKDNDMLSFEVAQNNTFDRRKGMVPFKSFQIPIDHKSIAGYVASTGKIINIPVLDDVGDEVPFSLTTMRDFDKKMDYKSVSMLAVPMMDHNDKIIGVLQLINALDSEGTPVPYDNEMEGIVLSLASQAAVAICNSHLLQDIKNLFESLVTYSAQAIDARSPHTAGHSERVSKLVVCQAEVLSNTKVGPFKSITFTDDQLNELRIAALLHDIGKIGVREHILDKMNKLSKNKLEAITNRLLLIRKNAENRGLIRKLALLETEGDNAEEIKNIDAETQKYSDDILSAIELVKRTNIPKYLQEEDSNSLKKLGKMKYTDDEGVEHPFLEPDELENLLVVKGNLTPKERTDIESHVTHTLKILKEIPFTDDLKMIPTIAAAHHEMLNGTGYPNKLTSEDILLQSRIIAVADIYDALTASDRPYKPPLPLNITLKILNEEADNGRLDRNVVDLFISETIYDKV